MKRTFDYRNTIKKVTIEIDYEDYINMMWILECYGTNPDKNIKDLPSAQEARVLKNQIEQSDLKVIWDDEDI